MQSKMSRRGVKINRGLRVPIAIHDPTELDLKLVPDPDAGIEYLFKRTAVNEEKPHIFHVYVSRNNDTIRRIFAAARVLYPAIEYTHFKFITNKLRKEMDMNHIRFPRLLPTGARNHSRFEAGHPFGFHEWKDIEHVALPPVTNIRLTIEEASSEPNTPVTPLEVPKPKPAKNSPLRPKKKKARVIDRAAKFYIDSRLLALEHAHHEHISKLRSEFKRATSGATKQIRSMRKEVASLRAQLLEKQRVEDESPVVNSYGFAPSSPRSIFSGSASQSTSAIESSLPPSLSALPEMLFSSPISNSLEVHNLEVPTSPIGLLSSFHDEEAGSTFGGLVTLGEFHGHSF